MNDIHSGAKMPRMFEEAIEDRTTKLAEPVTASTSACSSPTSRELHFGAEHNSSISADSVVADDIAEHNPIIVDAVPSVIDDANAPPAGQLNSPESDVVNKYKAITKLSDITATCKDDLATADKIKYAVLGWMFDGYDSGKQAAFKMRLGTFTEDCQVLYPKVRRGLATVFAGCRAKLGIPDMTTNLIAKRPPPAAEVERPLKRARDQEFATTPAVPLALDETISIGVTQTNTESCSALVKYVKQDERGQVIYVNGDQEMFVEAAGLMARLYGGSGKKLWADLEEDISVRKVKVSAMKGVKTLLDKRALRDIVRMLPIIGIKRAALRDVWVRLGGDIAECPSSHDSIVDSDKLHELAKIFQVEPDVMLTLHRRHALTPEEKDVLTINGGHKQLFALVDIARMVTGKDQNIAARQVRIAIEKDPENFKHSVLKANFGDGTPTQWAGDIYTAMRLIYRLSGDNARRIAESSAILWVQFWGGNIDIAEGVIQNRQAQEELAFNDPEHPMRIFGDEVDALQKNNENKEIIEYVKREYKRAYKPEELSEYHDEQKNRGVTILTDSIAEYFPDLEQLPASILVLDDKDASGAPRTTAALIKLGVPPQKILVPNHENQEVVDACSALGAKSVLKRLERAMESDFRNEPLVAAYIDGMSRDNFPLQGMIEGALFKQVRNRPFVLGFTLVGRNFQEGRADPLPCRLVKMWEYIRAKGFTPIDASLHHSCRVYRGNKETIATCFLVRKVDE